jgi:hypothetical protein
MKQIIIKVQFDDEDGYKGHGENTAKLIKNILEREMSFSLEDDGVIKSGWKVEIIDEV